MSEQTLTNNEFFDKTPSFIVKVNLFDFGHYDAQVIEWEAEKLKAFPPGYDGLAFHLLGFEHDTKGHAVLIFECKAFDDAGEMFENMPHQWAATNR